MRNLKRYNRLAQMKHRISGRSYVTENENLKVLLAFMVEVITWEELCKFFDLDPADYTTLAKVDDIRQAAITKGKELAHDDA